MGWEWDHGFFRDFFPGQEVVRGGCFVSRSAEEGWRLDRFGFCNTFQRKSIAT